MVSPHDNIIDVLRLFRMALEFGQSAGVQIDRVAVCAPSVVERLFGLEVYLRVIISVRFLLVITWIVIKFQLGTGIVFGSFSVAHQVRVRLLIVVIVEFNFAGPENPLRNPIVNVLLLAAIGPGKEDKR